MPGFIVTASDGKKYKLTPPTGASPDQVQAEIKNFIASRGASQSETELRAPVPPALKFAEDWLGVPLAGAGVAAGATAAGAAAGVPPWLSAPAGFGVGAAGAKESFRIMNRLLGYGGEGAGRPLEGRAAQVGALKEVGLNALGERLGTLGAPYVGKVAGWLGRKTTGIAARRKAQDVAEAEVTGKLNEVMTPLHENVDAIIRTAAPRVGVRELGRGVFQGWEGLNARALSAKGLGAGAALRDMTIARYERMQWRFQRGLGDRYEAIYQPFVAQDVPEGVLPGLGTAARQAIERQKEYASAPPPLRKIIDEMAGWGKTEAEVQAELLAAVQAGLPPPGPSVPPTWGRLKQIRGELRRYAGHPEGSTRTLAKSTDRSIVQAYGDGGLPRDPQLDKEYRNWRQRWDYPQIRMLSRARRPEQIAKLLDADLIAPLWNKATDTEKRAVKSMTVDMLRNSPMKGDEILRRFPPEILREMFGRGGDDAAMWFGFESAAGNVADLIAKDEATSASLADAIGDSSRKAFRTAGLDIKKQLRSVFRSLGPSGRPILEAVSKMSPEEALSFYLADMRRPSFVSELKQVARAGVPFQPMFRTRHLEFVGGVALAELGLRGAITSPYVLGALTVDATRMGVTGVRNWLLKSMEVGGISRVTRLLNRAVNPGTRAIAMKKLGRLAGQVAASDALRAALEEPDEGEPQHVIPPDAQPVVQ